VNTIVSFGNTFLTLTLSVLSLALALVYLPPQGWRLLRITTIFWPLALGLMATSGALFAAAPYGWAPLLTLANMTTVGASILFALIAASWNRKPSQSLIVALGIAFAISLVTFEVWRQAGAATFQTRVYFVCLSRAGFIAWMVAELLRFNRVEQSNQIRVLIVLGVLHIAANLARAAVTYVAGDGGTPTLYSEGILPFVTRIFILSTQILMSLSVNNYFVERLWRQERDASLHHQLMFDNSPAAGVLWDDHLRVTGWNHEASRLFGWPPAEAIGRRVVELLFPPEQAAEAERRFQGLLHGEPLDRFVIRTRVKDGRSIDCEWSHRRMPRRGNDRMQYVSLALDVSDRLARERQLERDREMAAQRQSSLTEELSRSERDLRGLRSHFAVALDVAGMGMGVRDLRTDQIMVSKRWREIFGFDRDQEPRIELVLERVHAEDQALVRSYRESLRDGKPRSLEYRIVRSDGSIRWISSWDHYERDNQGQFTFVRNIAQDVTERKVEQFELQQQRRDLTRLSRVVMMGELSGSLAHELNQPLTAILANAEAAQRFIEQDPPDLEELRAILVDIATQDRRAGEVISRLRQLLRSGETKREPLDVNEMIAETIRLLRSDLVSQRVTLHTELAHGLPPVQADRVQLQQVVINLVMNACDATRELPAAQRRLVLRSALVPGRGVQVSLEDNGHGLPPGDPERLFESFVTTKPDGMGLGLSICRTILQAHQGRLWAESNPEGGATFYFSLAAEDGATP
jgi:PAS domain S-box-containing protein